jgi:hypothetical protein
MVSTFVVSMMLTAVVLCCDWLAGWMMVWCYQISVEARIVRGQCRLPHHSFLQSGRQVGLQSTLAGTRQSRCRTGKAGRQAPLCSMPTYAV